MPVTDDQHRLLEQYLDGEADDAAAERVRQWVSGDDAAAEALERARALRGLRAGALDGGADDDAAVDRILAEIRNAELRERYAAPAPGVGGLRRWSGLAAAIVVVGTLGVGFGYLTDGGINGGFDPAALPPGGYTVQVVDRATGRVLHTATAGDPADAEAVRAAMQDRFADEVVNVAPTAAE